MYELGTGVRSGQVSRHLPSELSTTIGCEGKTSLVFSLRPALPLPGLFAHPLLPLPGKSSQFDQQVVAKGGQCALHIATSTTFSVSSLPRHFIHVAVSRRLLSLMVLTNFISVVCAFKVVSSTLSSRAQ